MTEQLPNSKRVYLCAPVNALVEGIYEQKIPFTQIKKHPLGAEAANSGDILNYPAAASDNRKKRGGLNI